MGNDFNKKLQGLFERPPDIPFDEKAWKRMEQKLHKNNFFKKYGLFIWLPFLITSLIGLFALGYYFGSQKTNETTPLPTPTQQKSISATQKNTSIALTEPNKTKMVIIYDTITTYVVKHTTVKEIETSFGGFYSPPTLLTMSAPLGVSLYDNHFSRTPTFDYPTFSRLHALSSSKKAVNNQEDSANELLSSLVQSIPSDMPSSVQSNSRQAGDLPRVEMFERKKPLAYYLYQLKPKNIGLTVSKGDFNNLNAKADIGKQINSSYGLRVHLYYNRRFSGLIGAEFIDNQFDFYTDQSGEDAASLGYPTIPPATPGDILHEIKGNFSYYQIPLGIHYNLSQKGIFEPFFGAGVYLQKSKESTLIYDYLANGIEYDVIKENVLPSDLKLSSYWSELGVRVYLSGHWALEGAIEGQFHIEDGFYKYEKQELLKWRAGLSFYF